MMRITDSLRHDSSGGGAGSRSIRATHEPGAEPALLSQRVFTSKALRTDHFRGNENAQGETNGPYLLTLNASRKPPSSRHSRHGRYARSRLAWE